MDMVSKETDVPLDALGDVLRPRKYHVSSHERHAIRFQNRVMGAESLMDLWRDGVESQSLSVGKESEPSSQEGADIRTRRASEGVD